jgi:type I restriction enzyme S subunit
MSVSCQLGPIEQQSRNGKTATVRVGEALRLVNGRAFKPSEWNKSGLPIVRIQNLNNPDAPFNYYEGDLPEKFLLGDGDLLFAWSGTPGTSFGAHIWRGGKAWLNQHIFKVHFDEKQFDKRYLQLAINRNLHEYIRAAHGGAGLAHITKGRFEESLLPCPPIDEQQHIVAEIEKQFTRLDAGVASLKRVHAALKRYRASVLKAACEGRLVLTEAELARKENRGYETGEQLLQRLLKERREKWNGKSKYKEPVKPDLLNPPSLPAGWCWVGTEQLSAAIDNAVTIGPFGSNLMVKDYREAGIPLIFVREIRSENFQRNDTRYVSHEKAKELATHKVRGGDVVITKMGEPPGDTAIYPQGFAEAIATSDCIKLTPNLAGTTAAFLKYVIRGQPVKNQIQQITRGVAQKKMSLARFKTIAIPLPPFGEQQRIVAEVERRLSLIRESERVVAAKLQCAIRLREAVLQEAFSGRV